MSSCVYYLAEYLTCALVLMGKTQVELSSCVYYLAEHLSPVPRSERPGGWCVMATHVRYFNLVQA
ncbi:hypothetical protein ElyMa_001358500, partial [Elysia marginata]